MLKRSKWRDSVRHEARGIGLEETRGDRLEARVQNRKQVTGDGGRDRERRILKKLILIRSRLRADIIPIFNIQTRSFALSVY